MHFQGFVYARTLYTRQGFNTLVLFITSGIIDSSISLW